MNIASLSVESVRALHDLIGESLTADDAAPEGHKPYGIRQHPDWRRQADELEAELEKRGEAFSHISW